jgi:hypothetical protein
LKIGGHGMLVMFDVTNPYGGMHAMTKGSVKSRVVDLKRLVEEDQDYLRAMVQSLVEATLEAEMTAALGAGKGERSADRLGYRSGHYGRSLVTRVGTLELRVPQDREGRFSTRLFERYQRSEKALVGAAHFGHSGHLFRFIPATCFGQSGHLWRPQSPWSSFGCLLRA